MRGVKRERLLSGRFRYWRTKTKPRGRRRPLLPQVRQEQFRGERVTENVRRTVDRVVVARVEISVRATVRALKSPSDASTAAKLFQRRREAVTSGSRRLFAGKPFESKVGGRTGFARTGRTRRWLRELGSVGPRRRLRGPSLRPVEGTSRDRRENRSFLGPDSSTPWLSSSIGVGHRAWVPADRTRVPFCRARSRASNRRDLRSSLAPRAG